MHTSWWLSWDAPERLIWARLTAADKGSAEVLDCDGKHHRFSDERTAKLWLNEDEYSVLAHMIEDGVVPESIVPPRAVTDEALAALMIADGVQIR
jgi:hypothetical protein